MALAKGLKRSGIYAKLDFLLERYGLDFSALYDSTHVFGLKYLD